MPIMIDEVVIAVEATSPSAEGGSPAAGDSGAQRQSLVAECVERVLEVLRQRQEP
ncbi:hypothetical protein KAK07_22450 [Ideonella sp. 4Y16]|uniref:Uncharacterized protein n=1 Tax=Ideonella alba TaxID=2824118 RepID=A0A941BDC1_9BURK|nr:DUF5908 family protein [Ideonella alba]MBQ0930061.1 hypothetical protein [Ideonella alba]MBQ0946121.1 hypothetical protein [Ideonella alba]